MNELTLPSDAEVAGLPIHVGAAVARKLNDLSEAMGKRPSPASAHKRKPSKPGARIFHGRRAAITRLQVSSGCAARSAWMAARAPSTMGPMIQKASDR